MRSISFSVDVGFGLGGFWSEDGLRRRTLSPKRLVTAGGRTSSSRYRRALVIRGATSSGACLSFDFLLLGALELGGSGGAIFGDYKKNISQRQLHPIAKVGAIDGGPAGIHASPFAVSEKYDNVIVAIVARVLKMEERKVFNVLPNFLIPSFPVVGLCSH